MKKDLPRYMKALVSCVFFITACYVHTAVAIDAVDAKLNNNIEKNSENVTHNSCYVTLASKKILQLSNSSREKARKCNGKRVRRAPKLQLDCSLSEMAKKHALELHERAVLSHQSADGSSLTDRANKLGIQWQALAENIANGYQDPAAVHNGWLNSGPHCKNIMNSTYNSIGVAGHEGVWVVVFAKK